MEYLSYSNLLRWNLQILYSPFQVCLYWIFIHSAFSIINFEVPIIIQFQTVHSLRILRLTRSLSSFPVSFITIVLILIIAIFISLINIIVLCICFCAKMMLTFQLSFPFFFSFQIIELLFYWILIFVQLFKKDGFKFTLTIANLLEFQQNKKKSLIPIRWES